MQQSTAVHKVYTVFYFCSGEGGGALGAQQTIPAVIGDATATCEVLGGIDVDPQACADAEMWTGVKFTQGDLMDYFQYQAFHGKRPPDDWSPMTLEQIKAAAQNRRPNIAVITAPCKGMSGLLGKDKAKSAKYDEGLNGLTFRCVFLALETWKDDPAGPPDFIIFENVKGMRTRGKRFLDKIKQLMAAYGYHWHDDHYDCGEWGGLAQHRKRFLGFGRRPDTVPCFLYNPPTQRVKAIGEVLEQMPMPIDPDNPPTDLDAAGGPMHYLPRLQWKTWLRLALIPPGGDWRDLQKIEPGEYSIVPVPGRPKHFDIVKTSELMGAGSPAITRGPSDGQQHANKYRVEDSAGPAHTVTGNDRLGSGAPAVADARPLGHTPMGGGKGAYLVQDVNDPSGTITGDPSHRKSGGASVIADHRLGHEPRDASMRVGDMSEPSGPIIGSAAVTSSNGIGAVADPNYTREPRSGVYAVQDTSDPSRTVTGGKDPNGNMLIVADPVNGARFNNVQRVTDFGEAAGAVTAACGTSNAASVVADPRSADLYGNMLRVGDFNEPGNTVTGAAGPNQGANLVADPRPTCQMRNGTMGVCDMSDTAPTVIGASDLHNGGLSTVADPRPTDWPPGATWDCRIPGENERGVWYIRSPHVDKRGRHCWHRPMTTLELLAIQGFPTRRPDGKAVVLAGKSDRLWREHIGNAWPPPAAAAIIGNMLTSLLASETVGFLWDYQQTGVLVEPVEQEEQPGEVA